MQRLCFLLITRKVEFVNKRGSATIAIEHSADGINLLQPY